MEPALSDHATMDTTDSESLVIKQKSDVDCHDGVNSAAVLPELQDIQKNSGRQNDDDVVPRRILLQSEATLSTSTVIRDGTDLAFIKEEDVQHEVFYTCLTCGTKFMSDQKLQDHVETCQNLPCITKGIKAEDDASKFSSNIDSVSSQGRRVLRRKGIHVSKAPPDFNFKTAPNLRKRPKNLRVYPGPRTPRYATVSSSSSSYGSEDGELSDEFEHPKNIKRQQQQSSRKKSSSKKAIDDRKTDPVQKEYTCEICSYSTDIKSSLTKHMLIHDLDENGKRKRLFVCCVPGCSFEFAKKPNLHTHMFKYHLPIVQSQKLLPVFKCPVEACVRKNMFSSQNGLKRHLKRRHNKKLLDYNIPEKKVRYDCTEPGCSQTFSRRLYYRRHMFKVHGSTQHSGTPMPKVKPKPKVYKCYRCEITFTNLETMEEHEKCHSIEKPHKCKSCYKRFARRDHLKTHEKVHLKDDLPFSCGVTGCDKSFANKYRLQRHERDVHEKMSQSTTTTTTTVGAAAAKDSATMKSDDADFCATTTTRVLECPFKMSQTCSKNCSKIFSSFYSLNSHLRTFHPDHQPFTCPVPKCKKKFGLEHYLTFHMQRVHRPLKGEIYRRRKWMEENITKISQHQPSEMGQQSSGDAGIHSRTRSSKLSIRSRSNRRSKKSSAGSTQVNFVGDNWITTEIPTTSLTIESPEEELIHITNEEPPEELDPLNLNNFPIDSAEPANASGDRPCSTYEDLQNIARTILKEEIE